ncbi:MAG: iron chelate uptake ABC transporter family permease subunit [Micropruina sp.]|uniref:FecCD family ABC transporter permease n=1 Tax=Micropruina sp. TaxID=2737536 RepID=UPI0039E6EDB5
MSAGVQDRPRTSDPRQGSFPIPLVGGWAPRRGLLVATVVSVIALVLAVVALGLGDLPLSPAEVVQALFATDGSFTSTVVRDWRLPRVLGALVFGAALALSGAIFQSLTRNPLGSPDVIGFATGAYTGALLALTVIGAGAVSASAGALVGGLLTAVVVYLLAYRRGMQGFRLIIVGIAVTAMLHAANLFLLLRAQEDVAMAAAIWGAGSIALLGWPALVPAMGGLVLCTPGLLLVPSLRQLELGDDAAAAHGVSVERSRIGLVLFAVALVAIVTASTGPIAFVALAAPQVARRLTGSAGIPLVSSAAVGAVVLLGADLIAQHVLPADVPVGIVTVVLGGVYLLTLLVHEARSR